MKKYWREKIHSTPFHSHICWHFCSSATTPPRRRIVCAAIFLCNHKHTHTRAHRVSLAFQASALLNFKGNILWTSHWQKPTANQSLSLALPDKHAFQRCQATTLNNNNSSVTSSDCPEEGPQLSSQPAHDATIVSQVNELHQVVMYRYKVADTGNQTKGSFICT